MSGSTGAFESVATSTSSRSPWHAGVLCSLLFASPFRKVSASFSMYLVWQRVMSDSVCSISMPRPSVGLGLLDFDADAFGRCALVREVEFLGHLGDKHIASVASGVHNEEAIPRDAEHD